MFYGFPGDVLGQGHWFNVTAVRITARNKHGFSSYANDDHGREIFSIQIAEGGEIIQGKFLDVFPGRSDGKKDLTTLKVHRDGRIQIILNAWGNTSYYLNDGYFRPTPRKGKNKGLLIDEIS